MQTLSRIRPRRRTTRAALAATLGLAVGVTALSAAGADTSGMTFSQTPLVGKVIWNDLITDDLDAAREFYGSLFGWKFEHSSGKGGRYMLARAGKVYVAGIVEVRGGKSATKLSRWLPYVSVANVDDSLAKASAAGARIAVAARNVNFGRVAAIIDPEGAELGLARSSIGDPDDATTAPGLGRVVWTELLAADPGVAAKFYGDVVGYDANTIARRGGQYTMLAHAGTNRSGVVKNPTDAAPVWLTYFGVGDAVAAEGRAEALGGAVVVRASPQLREGTMAVVTDPTGALLVLQKVAQ